MSKIKFRQISLLAGGLMWAGTYQAQTSVNTSGGDAMGSGGTVAYSLGQTVYTTNTGSSGSVSQGVQQTYEISNVGINESVLNISLVAFPNPTVDNLTLKISDFNNEILTYQLYDLQGKLLKNGRLLSEQTLIEMTSLPGATYLLHVVGAENLNIQSFKIIKN